MFNSLSPFLEERRKPLSHSHSFHCNGDSKWRYCHTDFLSVKPWLQHCNHLNQIFWKRY